MAAPARPARPGGRGLRLATFNADGLRTHERVAGLLRVMQRVDVLAVQETWVGTFRGRQQGEVEAWVAQLSHGAGQPVPLVFWAHNTVERTASAGVAILVRRSLVESGALQLGEPQPDDSGRLLVLPLRWGGQDWHLASVYLPCNGAARRLAFIRERLAPVAAAAPAGHLIVVGDFNYVVHARLDRINEAGTVGEQEPATEAALLASLVVHDVVDVWRAQRGRVAGGYTLQRRHAQSRIDRIYLPRALLAQASGARVLAGGVSDHCPLAVTLTAQHPPPPRGPGLRAISPAFLAHEERRERFLTWVEPYIAHGLDLPAAELLDWWPVLKRTVAAVAWDLAREHRLHAANAHEEAERAERAWREAQEALERASPANPGEFQRVFAAAAAARAQQRQQVGGMVRAWAGEVVDGWVHGRERPAPAVTAVVRPRPPAESIVELAGADGAPIRAPPAMAERLCAHFAGVSAARPVDAPAVGLVVGAMKRQQRQGTASTISAAAAQRAGRAVVTPEEVALALKASAKGKACGPDRLAVEVWAAGSGVWAPLLSRLFSAMMEEGRVPRGFLNGAVTAFHKRGDRREVANYRPIQLLNTDYRVLAKVLAGRFGEALKESIGPEQTAFLPGRQIGDNIRLAQLLPALLSARQQQGAMVFLDIAKAYDTVDRGFLLAAMEAHGADEGMMAWVRLLLSDTWAVAVANGAVSQRRRWEAGVRQGCPLSPALYLFVAEALACWLREQPRLGVDCEGRRLVTLQHADDTKLLLGDTHAGTVQQLWAALDTFSRASGQRINADKSAVLLIGAVPEGAPAELGGVPVVREHLALGVMHTNVSMGVLPAEARLLRAPPLPPDALVPRARLHEAWQRRLAAFAATTHRVMHHPASAMGRGLWLSTYGLSTFLYHAEYEGAPPGVLRQVGALAAAAVDRPFSRMPGVSQPLLSGSPASGGFGLLPLEAQVRALHLATATSLATELVSAAGGGGEAAPWASAAEAVLRQAVPGMHPLQVLAVAAFSTVADAAEGRLTGLPPDAPQVARLPPGPLRHMAQALAWAGPLVYAHAPAEGVRVPAEDVLPAWLRAVHTLADVVEVCGLLGWPAWRGQACLSFAGGRLEVRVARRFLVGEAVRSRREQEWQRFARQACRRQPGPVPHALAGLVQQAWRAPVDGRVKEVFLRLAVNGVNAAGGGGVLFTAPCACGWQAAQGNHSQVHRQHAFWDCPVAAAVRAQLQASMPAGVGVRRRHVWLLESPDGRHCTAEVWLVVAMVALLAMEQGRAALWAARQQLQHGQLPPGQSPVEVAQRFAVGRFWLQLMDVAAMATRLEEWPGVTPQHPFLAPRQPGTGPGVLEARVPVVGPEQRRRAALPGVRGGR